jgi:hypothetical protein
MAELRALQQVSVSVYRGTFGELVRQGSIGYLGPENTFARLVDDSLYHPRLGLLRPGREKNFESNIL